MTPEEISKLSNEKLNELIAKQRGYEVNKNNMWLQTKVSSLQPFYCQPFPPNYCNSWQWCGELLIELPGWEYHVYPDYAIMLRMRLVNDKWETIQIRSGHTRAISETWYLMECEK
jgi:hypothetical protein